MEYLVAELNREREQFLDPDGRHIQVPRKLSVNDYMLDVATALAVAQRKARENPGKQFAVFTIMDVFETTTPNVIRKTINDAGELVIKE